ncbi:exodeoxyribonuclease III [filamentous cyanobacterium LEGE 11480]|uniref:Exodeoxyribonuclease III n=1 Tax=Romeriopsis navalis LEGE 11480 TaxID=2777977 RepID=A0A928VQT8_9CYAN|nr:exodeoxyribonuclease III [Romeriopsis navalis]MBE9032976.1 exodeoxyribonuclease III [Romeriopsis navalis LEGE 11480]
MKIATWNVNSIRSRLEHATNWLQANPDVDLLCVQETKVVDEQFPLAAFTDIDYVVDFYGQKSYNGVALIAKAPLENVRRGFAGVLPAADVGDLDAQKRVISAEIQGIQVVNVYVPNGSAIGSEKYEYKLAWLKLLKQYLTALLQENPDLLICGDFNIALEDIDLHNPEKRAKHIMSSDVEREALQDVLALGLQDAFRKFNQEPGQYSWWDYRAGSFPRDKGWRIDHHYLTPNLYDRAVGCVIDKAPRELTKPSDHTPVIVEL